MSDCQHYNEMTRGDGFYCQDCRVTFGANGRPIVEASSKLYPHPMYARPIRQAPAPRHTWTVRNLVFVAIIGAAIGLWLSPGRAYAEQVEMSDRKTSTVRVSYVEPIGRRALFIELNNGAAHRLAPCELEDSRGCYWDADVRGNGAGRSFVALPGGRLVFSRMIGDAR